MLNQLISVAVPSHQTLRRCLSALVPGLLSGVLMLVLCRCGSSPERPSLHCPEYAALRVAIADLDTSGFEQRLTALQEVEHDNVKPERQRDLAILRAWLLNRRRDSKAAILQANEALNLLDNVNHDDRDEEWSVCQADMRFVLGEAYYRLGQVDTSFAHIQRSINFCRPIGYTHRLIRISLFLGRAALELGDIEGCMAQLRNAEVMIDTVRDNVIDVPRKMIDYTEAARAAIDICNMPYADRMLAKASLYYDRASDRCKRLYITQLVRQRFAFAQYNQAASALNKSEMLSSRENTSRDLSNEWVYQGLARSRQGELDYALQYLQKVKTECLDNEQQLVHKLLRGETALLQGHSDEAHAFLFDSVGSVVGRTQYEQLLIETSRQTYYARQGDYERVFNLINGDRTRMGSQLNEIYLQSDRLRDEQLRAAVRPNKDMEPQREQTTSRIRLLLMHILLLAALGYGVFRLVRSRERRAEQLNEARNSYLQDQLNTQMFELKKQSKSIEATNKRITESLTYAERIQQSIAPEPAELNDYPIGGSFIFFSPLDIVSGDFFWFMHRDDKVVVCCADCTGHGVPGALLTMLSTTIINGICEHLGSNELTPTAILNGLDNSLLSNLSHSNQGKKTMPDGVDIAVVVLDVETHELRVAAARRPTIVFKGDRLYNIRGTKRSIGEGEKRVRERPFEETVLQLNEGDKIYMFSDGYSDQFGGKAGEKMKMLRIEQFLQAIHNDDMDEQSLTIQEFFVQWKGDYAQVDDVLFIGLMV